MNQDHYAVMVRQGVLNVDEEILFCLKCAGPYVKPQVLSREFFPDDVPTEPKASSLDFFPTEWPINKTGGGHFANGENWYARLVEVKGQKRILICGEFYASEDDSRENLRGLYQYFHQYELTGGSIVLRSRYDRCID